MIYHDPISEEPFEYLPIPLPDSLKKDEDFTLLFQFMISEFYLAINTYGNKYGYGDRQRLLASILTTLNTVMPIVNPEYISEYPESLGSIRDLVAKIILTAPEFSGQHPDEE